MVTNFISRLGASGKYVLKQESLPVYSGHRAWFKFYAAVGACIGSNGRLLSETRPPSPLRFKGSFCPQH